MVFQELEGFVSILGDYYRVTSSFQKSPQEFATRVVIICDQNIHSTVCEE
jgi:hypothetical protein